MRRESRLVTFTVAALLSFTACGASSGRAVTGAAAADSTSAPLRSPSEAGSPVNSPGAALPASLDFTAPIIGGGTFTGASYLGKPLAMWFWAPY